MNFGCSAFERYNGILGHQPHNNRLIEPQLLRCFLRDNSAFGFTLPDMFRDEFSGLMPKLRSVGSIKDTIFSGNGFDASTKLGSKCRLDIFSADDTLMIRNLYVKLQSCSCEDVSVCATSGSHLFIILFIIILFIIIFVQNLPGV